MALTKLMLEELVGVGWLQHVDHFGGTFRPPLGGGTRPDLLGRDRNGDWVIVEAKGRQRVYESVKRKAKKQVERIKTVNGVAPAFRIACVVGFSKGGVQVDLLDPEGGDVEITFRGEAYEEAYYSDIRGIIDNSTLVGVQAISDEKYVFSYLEAVDIWVGLELGRYLSAGLPIARTPERRFMSPEPEEDEELPWVDQEWTPPISIGPDGVAVALGPTWSDRLG